MDESRFMDTLGWGFILWIFNYAFNAIVTPYLFLIGESMMWVSLGSWTLAAIVVAYKRLKGKGVSVWYYFNVAVWWLVIAAALDYLFTTRFVNPASVDIFSVIGYYYILTFAIPMVVGLAYGKSGKVTKR